MNVTFNDPEGAGKPISLERFSLPGDLADIDHRLRKIPDPDPHYVDLGMLYRFARLEEVRREDPAGFAPSMLQFEVTWGQGRTTTSSSSPPCSASPITGYL